MFLVQLSHNTIKKEIELLQNKVERKSKALDQSKKLLNEDEREVRNYVEDNNKTTKAIEEDAEKAQKLRKDKEEKLKNIEAEITALNYQSSKNNQDTLETLEGHKRFLEELSDQEFIKRKYDKQRHKIEELKSKWIKSHKDSTFEDHIIFAEEIEAQQIQALDGKRRDARRQQEGLQKGNYDSIGKRDGEFKFQRPDMTDADWENKFQYCLDNFLIDVPPEFYYEEIQFTDPDQISEKFAELEEKNLFLIHARQEIEQSLEELRNEEKQMKKDLTSKKINHEKKLKELEENEKGYFEIMRSKTNRFDMGRHGSKTKEGEEEADVFLLLDQLRVKIEKVYKTTKTDKIDLTAKETIDMLSEIETTLDTKVSELNGIRERSEVDVKKAENTRKVARKEKKLKETNEAQAKQDREKQEKASKASKAKEGTEFKGKPIMERSKKSKLYFIFTSLIIIVLSNLSKYRSIEEKSC